MGTLTERRTKTAPGDEPGASPRPGGESPTGATGAHPTVVGIPEIATRLGVKRATVDMWRHRGLLPPSRWAVGGRPAWNWPDVETWARETGRIRVP